MTDDIVDGEGVCVSFWTQGCPHHCQECHNPETWNADGGSELPNDYIEKVKALLKKNGIHRNISILGGEPMYGTNKLIVHNLLQSVKEDDTLKDIKVYLWSGYTFEDLLQYEDTRTILDYVDVLIDGRYEKDKRDITLFLRGSNNQRVIDVPESLKENKTVLYHK